jgi:hypothetical protein
MTSIIPSFAPEQITEYISCENPDDQPSFVYEFYCIDLEKFYIGYHKGEPFDGYYHSSKDKDFHNDFINGNYKWRYTIKDFGSESLMLGYENKLLEKNNARKNDKFYNKTNGIPQEFNLPDEELVADWAKQIIEDKCINNVQPKVLSKEDVKHYVKYQARVESINTEREKEIKDKINDSNGVYSKKSLLLVVLKDRNHYNDEIEKYQVVDLMCDGSHSWNGLFKSKKGEYIRVLEIPEEEHSMLSDDEVELLALYLNPRKNDRPLESSPEDIAKKVYKYRIKGLGKKCKTIQKILNRFNLTTSQRRKVNAIVDDKINDSKSEINKTWINWGAGVEKDELAEKIEKLNREPGTFANSYGTKINNFWYDLWKIGNINEEAEADGKPEQKIKIYKLVFWHQSKIVEDNWFDKDCSKNRRRLNYYLNRNGKDKDGVEVSFSYMDTTKSDTSNLKKGE